MGTEVINVSFDLLQEELDKAKSTLKGLNDNIRRISGREPSDQLRGERKRTLDRRADRDRNEYGGAQLESRNRLNRDRERERDRDRDRERERERDRERDGSPPAKRKPEAKSVFSRLSGPPSGRDDDAKPKLNSRIIRELPTKEEIVEAQGSDPASRARHRRMFGSLLGTLQKFCQEESRLKQKEQKKAQIEKKLEEQQNQEREFMKRERQNLYNNRKRQQLEIKMLESKMNLMKEFGQWEESKKPLMNFIRTKTKPRIYYIPKVMDKRTERKLDECKRDIEKQIEKRRAEVNEEMAEIVNRFEAATESLQPTNDSHNDSAQNNSLLDNSTIADNTNINTNNHMEENDSYYANNFKSMASKRNDKSLNHGNDHDDTSNDEDDTNDDKRSKKIVLNIKVEKDDEHFEKNEASELISEPQHFENEEKHDVSKIQRSRSSSQT